MRAHAEAVTIVEAHRLAALERVIGQGRQTFFEVGAALMEIRDLRLYKATHKTFESYCRERWGWSRQHAYRLIDAAEVKMSPMGDKVQTERQARELARVEPESRQEVVAKAAKRADAEARPMTAQDVKEATLELSPERTTPAQALKVLPNGQQSGPVNLYAAQIEDIGEALLRDGTKDQMKATKCACVALIRKITNRGLK